MRVNVGRVFIGRFGVREDLLLSLIELCKKEDITMGIFSVIGAVTNAKLGYYNQDEKKYVECVAIDEKLEITSCVGNVSLKDSEIFVHAHITLANHRGHCYGGHLMPGASIFAAEYSIRELTGGALHRKYDPETGLNLW
ncbi:MAG: DNA-binding protein [Candidatus Omnitrophota bacterium]|nr:MAG: DNA-binding protein [Candidatus Omnitrophota bacterium]